MVSFNYSSSSRNNIKMLLDEQLDSELDNDRVDVQSSSEQELENTAKLNSTTGSLISLLADSDSDTEIENTGAPHLNLFSNQIDL